LQSLPFLTGKTPTLKEMSVFSVIVGGITFLALCAFSQERHFFEIKNTARAKFLCLWL
jgi:hypothetical protein